MSRSYHSFLKRFIPHIKCILDPTREELVNEVASYIHLYRPDRLGILLSLRGSRKRLITRSDLEDVIRKMRVKVDRRARNALCIESIDELFLISIGEVRFCGLECITLVPFHQTPSPS